MKNILKAFVKKLFPLGFLLIASTNLCIAETNIAARVGDEIITNNDLERRYIAHIKMNDLLPSEEEEKAIKHQLIHSLIDEKVIIQGAHKFNITITDQEIEEEVRHMEQLQNLPRGTFFKHHDQYGVLRKDLKEQLTAKLAWQRILSEVVFPKHTQNFISDAEINEFIVQNHPSNMTIKGFIYQFSKDDPKPLKNLYKINKNNLCDIERLKAATGMTPQAINTSLRGLKNRQIQQVASFAKDDKSILISENGNTVAALILCEKKPVGSEAELDKIRLEIKNKKITPYAEHYFKNLKKNKTIIINGTWQ
jgi:hypothetical protein